MVWNGFQCNPQPVQGHQIAFASLNTLPMQFYPSTVTGRKVASELCEEAGDRNADAGGYFLNGQSSLRTLSDRIGRLIFKNPVIRSPSNQFLSGGEAGRILTPCPSWPCRTLHKIAMGKNEIKRPIKSRIFNIQSPTRPAKRKGA